MTGTELLMTIEVDVGPPQDIGEAGSARRRCIPITGGTVKGAHNGVVIGSGAVRRSPPGGLFLV